MKTRCFFFLVLFFPLLLFFGSENCSLHMVLGLQEAFLLCRQCDLQGLCKGLGMKGESGEERNSLLPPGKHVDFLWKRLKDLNVQSHLL